MDGVPLYDGGGGGGTGGDVDLSAGGVEVITLTSVDGSAFPGWLANALEAVLGWAFPDVRTNAHVSGHTCQIQMRKK